MRATNTNDVNELNEIDNIETKEINEAKAANKEAEVETKRERRKRTLVGTIILALIVIIIILLLRSCGEKNEAPSTSQAVTIDTSAEDQKDIVVDNPLADRSVFFSGIVDSTISKTGSIQLLNDERNEDFYMTFTVIDTKNTKSEEDDEVVYESDLVPSGQAIYWVPGEYLEEGEYHLNFKETPYYFTVGTPETNPNDYITLSVGNNTVTITII